MAVGTLSRVLVLGFRGGVGRAVLQLLARHPALSERRSSLEGLWLLDSDPGATSVELSGARVLPPRRIESGQQIAELVREHGIELVLDLSSVDSLECLRACAEQGASLLSTSVGCWPADEGTPTHELARRLLSSARPVLPGRGHLIGSGMNPGIVNALVHAGLNELALRAGVGPGIRELELHSVLVTEEDTTLEEEGPLDPDVFPMTWCPRLCLAELLEAEATFWRDGAVAGLGHAPPHAEYHARCGPNEIAGMVVPHEEVLTLGAHFDLPEVAFVYRILPAARDALLAHPNRGVSEWRTRRLYPPHAQRLKGWDRVGVLLCSRRFGELWIGFTTDVRRGLAYETNATELQVAAGVIAGWNQIASQPGIHLVEELDWRDYLEAVETILGAPEVIHDREAPPRMLTDRLIPA